MREPTEMELRVANAILGTLPGVPVGVNALAMLTEKSRDTLLDQARTAIRAMREPTQTMLDAADRESGPGIWYDIWEAMIDAASPKE